MKQKLFFAVVAAMMLSLASKAQLTFSVATGIGLNTAHVGFQKGHFMPFIAIQGIHGAYNYSSEGYEYDNASQEIVEYTREDKVKGTVIAPSLGLRYLFLQGNTVQTYVTGSVSKFLAFSNDDEVNDELNNVSAYGSELGFGAEYYFDEHFSIAGEFGLRMLWGKNSYESMRSVYNENTMTNESKTFKYTDRLLVSPTYTKIALNFHF